MRGSQAPEGRSLKVNLAMSNRYQRKSVGTVHAAGDITVAVSQQSSQARTTAGDDATSDSQSEPAARPGVGLVVLEYHSDLRRGHQIDPKPESRLEAYQRWDVGRDFRANAAGRSQGQTDVPPPTTHTVSAPGAYATGEGRRDQVPTAGANGPAPSRQVRGPPINVDRIDDAAARRLPGLGGNVGFDCHYPKRIHGLDDVEEFKDFSIVRAMGRHHAKECANSRTGSPDAAARTTERQQATRKRPSTNIRSGISLRCDHTSHAVAI